MGYTYFLLFVWLFYTASGVMSGCNTCFEARSRNWPNIGSWLQVLLLLASSIAVMLSLHGLVTVMTRIPENMRDVTVGLVAASAFFVHTVVVGLCGWHLGKAIQRGQANLRGQDS